jgi:hypothetical protein
VDVDAEPGRTSSEGVRVLARLLRPEHEVVVFPLGTNDTSADVFAANLAAVEQLAGGRCVLLATIAPARPARLPARVALLRLSAALSRALRPVAAALRDARTAATQGEPEPVLGAP